MYLTFPLIDAKNIKILGRGILDNSKNRNFIFENIRVLGNRSPRVKLVGYDDAHKTENFLIRNITLNGTPIEKLDGENWSVNEYCENIRITKI